MVSARCTRDTDGDGDCAACARNPQATCRMTARETLTTTLTNLLARTRNGHMDAHRAEAERLVAEVLDEQANGLAEKIRRETARRNLIREEHAEAWEAGLHRGADVITPRCLGCGEPRDNGQAHGYGGEFGGCV